MESITVKKEINTQGIVGGLELSGVFVLENSLQLKEQLFTCTKNLDSAIKIEVKNVLDIDISCIQVILAFIRFMDNHHISYTFEWNLSEEHQTLLENVGFANELFLN